jgi:UDP-glucose 4-epimerase
MIVLITGANGFIGSAIVLKLASIVSNVVRAAVRKPSIKFPKSVQIADNLDLSDCTDWGRALEKIDVVIHCAARVHVMNDTSKDPINEFRKINTDGTLNLARQAALAGVKRFIFISTLGVNGAETSNIPYKADDIPHPHSPYAQSKLEAELGLREISESTNMSIVIIRPPLVYGPNAPGNFGSLLRWVNRRIPLPLGAIKNKRSFIFLDNLVDMIICCIEHPNAVNQVFLVSDDEDLSTTELLKKMGSALNKSTLLLPIPMYFLNTAARIVGKSKVTQQLLGSLQVDIEKTKTLLNWKPPYSVDVALKKTAEPN